MVSLSRPRIDSSTYQVCSPRHGAGPGTTPGVRDNVACMPEYGTCP